MTARWLLGSTLVGLVAVGGLVLWLWPVLTMLIDPARITRTYYIPAESMMPTLAAGDRVRPLMPDQARLVRGAVVVFQGPDSARVARIVGVGGDVVAMRKGRLSINDNLVPLTRTREGPRLTDGTATVIYKERLPNEGTAHGVLDAGESVADEVAPVRVPENHFFVLGDNRDRAADSRYPLEEMGVGFVPREKVIGVVDRILWSKTFGDRGRPIR